MPARKKDPSTRARANKASTAATLPAHPVTKVPALPEHRGWTRMTAEWWSDVWSSPMSAEWHESDIHNLYVCAMLYDDMWLADSAAARQKAAAEFRQQRAMLGLTPYDRRRLEWTIESAEEAKDRGSQRRSAGQPKPAARSRRKDPRSALHVVS